jgi:hypothetical protein
MELLLVYLVLAFVVGVGASARDRSGAGWFLVALIVSPLIAGILVLLLPNRRRERLDRERHMELLGAVNPEYQSKLAQASPVEQILRQNGQPLRPLTGWRAITPGQLLIALGVLALLLYYFAHHGA